ncbi:hypothetical protein [Streptomyces sp. TRM70350]|uniref:hypothetical protein n=1 Tax=Streptomyces sp. TRM70350 TaxID=2856165 RepID=UPI001C4922F8|nr:hypothetical protein [Streptomyces sp. TRM70350]MBV7696254.1 hypothetical protein [Streptomyces sp. TRM70350]
MVVLGSANPEFFVAHFELGDVLRSMEDPDLPQSKYPDINVLQALTTTGEALPQTTIGVAYGILNRALPADELGAYVDDLAQRVAERSAGSLAAVNQVLAKVFGGAVDAQFAGFAVESEAMRAAAAK